LKVFTAGFILACVRPLKIGNQSRNSNHHQNRVTHTKIQSNANPVEGLSLPFRPSGHTYKCHPELMTRHAGKSFTSGLRVILCWRLANISRSRSGRLPRFVASSANMAMSSSLGIFKADTPFRCRRRGLLSGVLEHHPNWYIDEVQSALSEKNSK